jgi:putative Mn2+ efflux pump MntP
MSIFTVLFIAIGLAMDSFSVSIINGLTMQKVKIRKALKIAFIFGVFQGGMPVLGWLVGIKLKTFIANIDHWIAFFLLLFIGIKMILEAQELNNQERIMKENTICKLCLLGIATSIDALVVGLSLSFLQVAIIYPAIIIGLVTFFFAWGGVYIGNKLGHFFEKKILVLGGGILILIGVKILIEHLW